MSHILFINHTRELHGSEQVLLSSLVSAHDAGHRVSVLLPSHVSDGGLDASVRSIADEVLYLPYRPSGESWLRTRFVRLYNSYALHRIVRYIKREGVDVVYSNTIVTTIGVCAARACRIVHVWHWHELPHKLFGWRSSLKGLYRSLVKYKGNRIVCISHHQQSAWEEVLGCRLRAKVVYNPIRPVSANRVAHEGVRIGYLGAFAARKNIEMLVKTFERLHATYPETELWLCGARSADEIERVRSLSALPAEVLRVSESTDDVVSFYSQIDIFVLPSYAETMPLVVLEALQAHVCVLQTTQSGMSELLRHKKDCLFFPPTRPDILEEQLRKCMDEAYRESLASCGERRVRELLSHQKYNESIGSVLSND